jgi:hypothetical protein
MDESFRVLSEDGEPFLCRGSRLGAEGRRNTVLVMLLTGEHPPPFILDRLKHEFELKDELDGACAARPLELVREDGRTMLLLEDPGGEPLARLVGAPMEVGTFLRLAIGVAGALGKTHQRGLVHKDLKPTHILVNCADGEARPPASASLRGFLANGRRSSRPKPSPARWPIWRRSRPDG